MQSRTLALVCILGSVVTGLLGVILFQAAPFNPLMYQLSFVLSVALVAAYFYFDFKNLKVLFSRKTARYGLNSIFMALFAVGIMAFVNMIAKEYDVKKDFTANKLHSLAPQTVKILKDLDFVITIRPVVGSMMEAQWKGLFDKFAYYTDNLKLDFIDPDREPGLVKQYNIQQAGSIVVESDQRNSIIENSGGGRRPMTQDPKIEEKIVNAIIKVSKGDKKKMYFVYGHGERRLSESKHEGLSNIKARLESGRYDVEDLLLVEKKSIPEDADIVVLAGPRSKIFPNEIAALTEYLKEKGGKILLLVDPDSSSELKEFLAKYGIEWTPRKVIFEASPLANAMGEANPLLPIVTDYTAGHPVTASTSGISVYSLATPLRKKERVPAGYQVDKLFSTRAMTFQLNLPKNGRMVVNRKALEKKGPFDLAYAIEGNSKAKKIKVEAGKAEDKKEEATEKVENEKFRMIVVGDSDFTTNGNQRNGVNSDLFQNMLAWLADEEDLISLRPKATNETKLNLTPNRSLMIKVASFGGLPLILFFLGGVVWITRRRK